MHYYIQMAIGCDLLGYDQDRISNRAGIKKSIHPHQLRHSYATHMINNGAPLEVIQSLLGHEKSETTKIDTIFIVNIFESYLN